MRKKDRIKKDDVLNILDYKALYRILDKNIPQSTDTIIERLVDYKLCKQIGDDWVITNLGAILFANKFKDFPNTVFYLRNEDILKRCKEIHRKYR